MEKEVSKYEKSGVDITAGNTAVDLIKPLVAKTLYLPEGAKVLTGLGGFCAIIELPDGRIMGVTTDGVGTKIVPAILKDKHNTIGIDLCAMCFNDLLASGINPAIFLDYIAMGKQVPLRTKDLISGMVDACCASGCALVGGEMAEMPGIYSVNHYDLAGFAVGFLNSKEELILGEKIEPCMKVYGLPSSGLHSNGYALYNKIFDISLKIPDGSIIALNKYYPELGKTLGEELLTPTKIYTGDVAFLRNYQIAGMANITGGGLIENPPRILPDGCGMVLNPNMWNRPPIFDLIERNGVSKEEMLRVSNYGIGFIYITPDDAKLGVPIGEIIKSTEKKVFFE
ncbi:MAG: phosphoribosylformylglycinamidine cyclo-ligase [bacterium]